MKTLAECNKTYGLVAGTLLFRVQFWMRRATKARRKDKFWIAKTREEWMLDTGMTSKQVRTAFEVLKKAGVIETGQFIWGEKNVLHTRLISVDGHLQTDTEGDLQMAPTGQLNNQENKQENEQINSDEFIAGKPADPSEINLYPEEKVEMKKPENPKIVKKANPYKGGEFGSVTDLLKAAKAPPKPQESDTPAEIWKKCMVGAGVQFVSLTGEDIGKLKHIVTKLPLGMKPISFFEWVTKHWLEFASEAKDAKGSKKAPEKPHIGFLLANIQTAVNVYLKARLKAKKQELAEQGIKPQPKVHMGPVQSIALTGPKKKHGDW